MTVIRAALNSAFVFGASRGHEQLKDLSSSYPTALQIVHCFALLTHFPLTGAPGERVNSVALALLAVHLGI